MVALELIYRSTLFNSSNGQGYVVGYIYAQLAIFGLANESSESFMSDKMTMHIHMHVHPFLMKHAD